MYYKEALTRTLDAAVQGVVDLLGFVDHAQILGQRRLQLDQPAFAVGDGLNRASRRCEIVSQGDGSLERGLDVVHELLLPLVDQLEQGGYTAATKCLARDLDALVVHLRYPTRHRRRWRSTNLLERSLGEVKRRTKVIGRFPGETSCLTLVWAVLDLYITHATNGIKFTQLERQRLRRMRYAGTDRTTDEEVSAA